MAPEKEPPVSEAERCLFGRNLHAARKARGLTTLDVEAQTGIHRSRLALIEAGKHNVTIETMVKLARVVDHDLNHLLTQPPGDV